MAISVKNLITDETTIDCVPTQNIFKKLKGEKLKPYIMERGVGGFIIKVHYKKKYFLIAAKNNKFQQQSGSSLYKWVTYKDFKDLLKKMGDYAEGKYPPSFKMKDYMLGLCSRFPDAYSDEDITDAMEDAVLCKIIIEDLSKRSNDTNLASEKQKVYLESLIKQTNVDIGKDLNTLSFKEARELIASIKELIISQTNPLQSTKVVLQ